jgi:hypothetical protein
MTRASLAVVATRKVGRRPFRLSHFSFSPNCETKLKVKNLHIGLTIATLCVCSTLLGCRSSTPQSGPPVVIQNPMSPANVPSSQPSGPQIAAEAAKAPPASQTGGFDGALAYKQVAKLVSFGPRPPASDAIHHTQDYIHSQLVGFGCAVDEDSFNAQTPIGTIAMKNIIAKVPGTGQGIILLLTHYDTLRLDGFVGAEDGGSSSGLMLEMARLLCGGKPRASAVWIAFLDGFGQCLRKPRARRTHGGQRRSQTHSRRHTGGHGRPIQFAD